MVSSVLDVLGQPETEIESKLDQVSNMTVFGVFGGGQHGHNELENTGGGRTYLA